MTRNEFIQTLHDWEDGKIDIGIVLAAAHSYSSAAIAQNTVLATASSPEREKDILELCRQVLNASPAVYYNSHGADDSTCPFCHKRVYYADADISEIKHSTNCAYLIAKDLSTNCR